MRGELPGALGVEGVGGLLLDDRVDLFEEREVVGVDAVERRLGEVDEPGLAAGCRPPPAGRCAWSAASRAPSSARITIQFEYVGDWNTK